MRRRLILVFLAISIMVAMAFVVPLGFLVQRTAEDRAIDAARADAAAVVPALVSGSTQAQIVAAVGATSAGRENRMVVVTANGMTIGSEVDSTRLDLALESGSSAVGDVDGGVEVVAAVASGPNELSAVRVFVDDSELRKGQWRAWMALAAVGVALVGISVLVADRLSRTIVRPTEQLALAARRLGAGDLGAKVQPDGPPELLELAGAFNDLGSQVGSMLERERELVAELSHRMRTPLTKLRLRLEQVTDPELAQQLSDDIDDLTIEVNTLIEEARGSLYVDEDCDVGLVVTERADFWSVLADDQRRPWRFERGQGRLHVNVSAADLAAAVDVLLENVFAHTEDGAPLTVGFARDAGEVRIWVHDAGTGIATNELERGESSAGSTGLGLDIARTTAERAGGRLAIGTSDLGGAAVELRLPLVAGDL